MRIENVKNMRVLVAENGYLTQDTDEEIDNRIFVKEKMLLPFESESDYKEVAAMEAIQQPQIIYDQLVSDLIRAKYTIDQEIAINRQRDTKPEEFQAYFDYCEQCKIKAHEQII